MSVAVYCRCISVGTRQGFGIYNCEPFGKCFQEHIGGIGIAEMLYCTSLVALVGAGEQVRDGTTALSTACRRSFDALALSSAEDDDGVTERSCVLDATLWVV